MTRLARSASAALAALVAVAAGVLTVTVALGTTAEAGTAGQIGLSRDGENWDDWTPLFDGTARWVPGDERRESFFVRNDGPTTGALVVEVVVDDPDGLIAAGHLELRARIAGGDWQPTAGGTTALPSHPLEQGAAVQVDVEAAMRWDAPNSAQNGNVSIDIWATLSEAEAPQPPPGGTGGDPAPTGPDDPDRQRSPLGPLAMTGTSVTVIVVLAALTLGCGIALVRRSRRAAEDR